MRSWNRIAFVRGYYEVKSEKEDCCDTEADEYHVRVAVKEVVL